MLSRLKRVGIGTYIWLGGKFPVNSRFLSFTPYMAHKFWAWSYKIMYNLHNFPIIFFFGDGPNQSGSLQKKEKKSVFS
jgi:hypothetical protein